MWLVTEQESACGVDIVPGAGGVSLGSSGRPIDRLSQQSEIINLKCDRRCVLLAWRGTVDALATALQDRERQRVRLQQELAGLDGLADLSTVDVHRIDADLRRRRPNGAGYYDAIRRCPGRSSRSCSTGASHAGRDARMGSTSSTEW
jgi:hypothetical protein